jgi:hypothetical protein
MESLWLRSWASLATLVFNRKDRGGEENERKPREHTYYVIALNSHSVGG